MGTLNVTSTSNGIMEQLRSALSDQFSAIAPFEIVLGLVLGLLVGLLIAFVYKQCFRGVLYSPSFAMTLAMLTLITTPVVMCISSNVALSMGMVGALSIVRFRTAVKDPMDTAYMFWALTMGILLGAKLYAIALVVAAAIAAIIFLLTFVHFTTPNSYLLVVHYDEEAEYDVDQMMPNPPSIPPPALQDDDPLRRGNDVGGSAGQQAGFGGADAGHRGRA